MDFYFYYSYILDWFKEHKHFPNKYSEDIREIYRYDNIKKILKYYSDNILSNYELSFVLNLCKHDKTGIFYNKIREIQKAKLENTS